MRTVLLLTAVSVLTVFSIKAEEPRSLLKSSARSADAAAFREVPKKVAGPHQTLSQMLAGQQAEAIKQRPSGESSLLSSSIILWDGVNSTVVPVGSILHLPAGMQEHVIPSLKGNFMFWPAFLKQNQAWLTAREVPLSMAKGDAKAAEPILRAVANESHAVVSVFRGSPISILEARPESSATRAASAGR